MNEAIQGTELENYFVVDGEDNRLEIEHAGRTAVLVYRNPSTKEMVAYDKGKIQFGRTRVKHKNDLGRRVKFAREILVGCEKYAYKGEDGKVYPLTPEVPNWKDKIPLQHLDVLTTTIFDGASADEVEDGTDSD